jgi:hypothetical protein
MMINKVRLQKLIDVMQRVADGGKSFDLGNWQDVEHGHIKGQNVSSEKELHACGMSACVGGYLALSSEFRKEGGSVNHWGAPAIKGSSGYNAVEIYLECSDVTAECITNPDYAEEFYGFHHSQVTPEIVVDRLKDLLVAVS